MKHLVLIAFVALFVVHSGCEDSRAYFSAPPDEQQACDSLSKALVTAISANDYAAFSKLWVTASDWAVFMRSNPDPRGKAEANDSANHARTVNEHCRKSFDNVRAAGVKDGIVWEKCTYKSSSVVAEKDHGLTFYRLDIIVEYNGKEYPMNADGAVMTPGGMKLNGGLSYGPYVDPIEHLKRMVDSMNIADSLARVEQKKKTGK